MKKNYGVSLKEHLILFCTDASRCQHWTSDSWCTMPLSATDAEVFREFRGAYDGLLGCRIGPVPSMQCCYAPGLCSLPFLSTEDPLPTLWAPRGVYCKLLLINNQLGLLTYNTWTKWTLLRVCDCTKWIGRRWWWWFSLSRWGGPGIF